MAGANYMGGKRNAVKARSKNPVLRAQKDFFGRQRLGLGSLPKAMLLPAVGTVEGTGTTPSEIDLRHAKRRRRNSACSEEDFGFVPGPTPMKPPVSCLILEASGSSSKRSKVLDALDETDPMFIRAALDRVLKMPDLAGLLPRTRIQMPASLAKRRRTDMDVGSRDNNKRQHLLSPPADRHEYSPEGQAHHEHDVNSPHCLRPTLPNQHWNVTQLGSSLPDSSIPSSDLALTSSPSSLGLRQPDSPEVRKKLHGFSEDVSKDVISVENLLYQDDPWHALDVLLDFKPSSFPRRSTNYEDLVASRLNLNPLREHTKNTPASATILSDERHNMSKSDQSSRHYLSSDPLLLHESSASSSSLNVSASDRGSNVSESSKKSHRPIRFFPDSIKPPGSDYRAGYISGSEILEVSSHHGDRSASSSSPLHRISSASWNLSPNFALHHASPQSNKNEFDAISSSPHDSLLEPTPLSSAICLNLASTADRDMQRVLFDIDAPSPLPLSEDIGQYSTFSPIADASPLLQRQPLSPLLSDHREHVFFDDPTGPDPDEESVIDIPGDVYDKVSVPPVDANQTAMANLSAPQLRLNLPADIGFSMDLDDELYSIDDATVETVDQRLTSHNVAVAQIDASADMTNRDSRSPIDATSLPPRKDQEVYMGFCLFSDEGEESD